MAEMFFSEQTNSCLSHKKFRDSMKAIDTISSVTQKTYVKEEADKLSEMFRPKFIEVMQIWKFFIQNLLKEGLEKIFAKIVSTKNSIHLKKLIEKSLLHHSSSSKKPDAHLVKEVLERGAAKMSCLILPNPDLWTSHLDSYKAHLMEKIDEVVPTFEANGGINQLIIEITGVDNSLADFMFDINDKQFTFSFFYSKKMKCFDYILKNSSELDSLLKLYYGSYLMLIEKKPDCLVNFLDPLFASSLKSRGKISGPYLCKLLENVIKYKKEAWIYPDTYCCLYNLLFSLASILPSAISSFAYQHLDFHIWDD